MSSDDGGTESPDGTESDTYVHRPSGEPPASDDGEQAFDWRGWTLVATVFFAFIVAPGSLLYLQQAQSLVASIGLSWIDAYLVLPLAPAMLLGAVAVWSAVRARSDEG
jgi:hypothetical protein